MRYHRWTEAEEAILRNGNYTSGALAKLLGVSKMAIRAKRYRLLGGKHRQLRLPLDRAGELRA